MPTVSIILPLQKKLLVHDLIKKEGDTEVVNQMKQAMRDDLCNRYKSIQEFLQECTALDPRFKTSCLTPQESLDTYHRLCTEANTRPLQLKVEPDTDRVITESSASETPPLPVVPDIETSTDLKPAVPLVRDISEDEATSLAYKSVPSETGGLSSILGEVIFVREDNTKKMSDLERANAEIERFKTEPLLPISSDPLEWWKNNQWQFPLLPNLARKRLCILATSVPSERVFSTAGDIVTAQRAALSPEVVDMLIILKKNIE